MKSVYLDQFVYSEWAKAASRGQVPESLRLITAHVSKGRMCCPLSLAHACELARWQNFAARDAALDIMLNLSHGLVMAHIVDVCRGDRPLTWAPFIVPTISVLQSTIDFLDGHSPAERLKLIFKDLATNGEEPANQYIENMLTGMKSFSDQQVSPSEAFTKEEAWVLDVCRLRTRDPKRTSKRGDAFDILHSCYAGLTDYGVVDRAHAAMVGSSPHLKGRIFSRVEDLLHALDEDFGS